MPHSWYTRCQVDHYCYMKRYENYYIILLLYVDNMLFARSNMEKIKDLKEQLLDKFEMELGLTKKIYGKKITRDRSTGTLKLS